ncbi:MAG: fibronectin type III domain-containing protein, partial [Gaiellaceae bacterium]
MALLFVASVAFALASASHGATLNTAQLDNGACGRNLQLGSDKTSSSSATPSFLIAGDGGLSRYEAFVDGASIGTFASDGFANVCVYDTIPLADGSHVLTANELQPHAGLTVVPFNFSVDTVPPAQPSTPVISGFSDSGLLGDHITRFRNPNFTGFADPKVAIQLYNGQALLGGAQADVNGAWSATLGNLADGSYIVTAIALDQAGNKSMLSVNCPLTVDGTLPTGGLTNPANGSVVSGTVPLNATGADSNGIWKVDFQVDGLTKSTALTSPFSFSWNSSTVPNGSHTLTAVIHDYPDNVLSSTITVNVQNGGATAPGAPTLNSATAGNASATLNWTAPASTGGSAITGYKVYRGTASGGETLLTTLGNVTSWSDAGLTNGVPYYYKVTAVNAVGESLLSNEVSAVPAGAPGPPTLTAAAASSGSVALTWNAPSSNGGAGITGYRVYRGTASGGEILRATLGAVTSWSDTGLANGTTYYYRVTALNSVGESSLSNELSAAPTAAAAVPGAPTLNSATAGNTTVALSWSAPASNGGSAVTGYKVYRGTTSGGETLLTTVGVVSSFTDTGLANGTTYYYKVSALNSVGEGSLSNEQFATPAASATVPGAPTLTSATAGVGNVALSWSAPASDGGSAVTGYKVWRGTTSGGETLLTTLGNVNGWTDAGVANGTTYYYKVSALNGVGESVLSGERFATPAASATIPGAPTLASATGGSGSIALAWSAPASNGGSAITGYKVWRATTSGGEALLTSLGNVTGWTDAGVTNGTTYYYKVTAINGIGQSVFSNEKFATPGGTGASAPGAPALISAGGGNASVVLSWSAPTSDGGAAITSYRVYRGTASGAETLLATVGNVTGFTDGSLTNGTAYYYKVSAVNSIGEGALSSERSAIPATVPNPPTWAPSGAGNGQVSLNWTPPSSNGGSAVTGYKLYRSTASGAETLLVTLGNVTSYNDAAVVNGTTYYYKVGAVNAMGDGPMSSEQSATPTTVPGAPTLTSATGGNNSVSLGWSAPASNGGLAVTGYNVYRGTASGGEILLTTLGNVTSYTDNGAVNGTTYYYEVAAANAVGQGALSNERFATPTSGATAPTAPALNSATAGNASVSLSWTAPASNGGSAITSYRVYRGTASGGETFLATIGNVVSFNDTGLTNGTAYFYKVTAVNAVGESATSAERSATPAGAPSAPTLTATAGNASVGLSWTAPAANGSAITSYKLYRGTSSGGETLFTTLGNVTSYNDTSAANGTTYYYVVSAVNGIGEGATSGEGSAMPATTPGAPTLNSAVPGNSVTLSWSAPSANGGMGVTGYRIYRGTTSGGETFMASVGLVTTYTDTTTISGTTYYFKVTALNAMGEGSMSNELSATPTLGADTAAPSTPTNVTAPLVGTSQVVVGWTASTDNVGVTGYRVFRDGVLVATVSTTHYLDSGMSAGSFHSYQVRAFDAAGLQSAASTSTGATLEPLGKNAQATLGGVVYDSAGRVLPDVAVTLTLSNGSVKTATT